MRLKVIRSAWSVKTRPAPAKRASARASTARLPQPWSGRAACTTATAEVMKRPRPSGSAQ